MKGHYILREIGLLLIAAAILFGLIMGAVSLLRRHGSEQAQITQVDLYLGARSKLKTLIRDYLISHEDLISDTELNAAIAVINDRLLGILHREEDFSYEPEIVIVDSPVVNAVTLPGDLIVLHSGLIERMENAEEMAAVIAHELGHVVNRDILKQMARQMGISVLLSAVNGQGGDLVLKKIVQEAVNIRLSRTMEEKADDFAIDLLARAGVDPAALGDALASLKMGSDEKIAELLKYIDTHPDIDDRIGRAYAASDLAGVASVPFDIDWQRAKDSLPSIF